MKKAALAVLEGKGLYVPKKKKRNDISILYFTKKTICFSIFSIRISVMHILWKFIFYGIKLEALILSFLIATHILLYFTQKHNIFKNIDLFKSGTKPFQIDILSRLSDAS